MGQSAVSQERGPIRIARTPPAASPRPPWRLSEAEFLAGRRISTAPWLLHPRPSTRPPLALTEEALTEEGETLTLFCLQDFFRRPRASRAVLHHLVRKSKRVRNDRKSRPVVLDTASDVARARSHWKARWGRVYARLFADLERRTSADAVVEQ